MEYRLNKIDTDARRKMIEKTNNEKIHRSDKSVKVNKDKTEKEKLKKSNLKQNKNYVTIDGEKRENKNLEIEGEIEINKKISIGTIVDKRG